MQKKLKKVKDLQAQLNTKLEALNYAYGSGNGLEVDQANEELFKLLETTILKDSNFHTQMKNHTWQRNHLKILGSISDLMQKNNCMPTNTQISIAAGLSEETIYKHLKEFKDHELYKHEADKYQFMLQRVLTTVFNLSVQGDIRACKVFMDYFISNNNVQAPTIKQTNYIQINQTKLSQDIVQQLTPDQLNQIEAVLQSVSKVIPVIK